jgi:predicted kinase
VKPETKPDAFEQHFTKEQLAKIDEMAKTQKSMPKLELSKEEINERAAAELAKTPAEQGKRLDLIIGPPSAGKSTTFVDPLMKEFGGRLIDPDKIKLGLPGYAGGLGADAVHVASSKIAGDMVQMALQNGDSMVLPKLGKTVEGLTPLIDEAKALGYKVNLHLADVPPEISAQRSFARAFPEDGSIGQWVNPNMAYEAGTMPAETFESLISKPGYIDSFSHYDMNVPKGADPILVKQSLALAA